MEFTVSRIAAEHRFPCNALRHGDNARPLAEFYLGVTGASVFLEVICAGCLLPALRDEEDKVAEDKIASRDLQCERCGEETHALLDDGAGPIAECRNCGNIDAKIGEILQIAVFGNANRGEQG